MTAYRRIGFSTFIVELPAPYDLETMESLVTTVKPMVESVPGRLTWHGLPRRTAATSGDVKLAAPKPTIRPVRPRAVARRLPHRRPAASGLVPRQSPRAGSSR